MAEIEAVVKMAKAHSQLSLPCLFLLVLFCLGFSALNSSIHTDLCTL